MRATATLAALLLAAAPPLLAADYPAPVLAAKRAITADTLMSHVRFLASEHCRGRETGQPGMDVAIAYLTSVLEGADVQPAGEFGGYRQEVPLRTRDLGDGNLLEITQEQRPSARTTRAVLERDFLPVSLSAEQEVGAPLVFAGYGITAPDLGYDDYRAIDARGKAVLVMRHEPGENDASSRFDGTRTSNHGTLLAKILNAQKHGAAAVIFVTDPLNHQDREPGETGGTSWVSLRERRMQKEEDFRFMRFSPRMQIAGDDFGVRIPAVAVDGALADRLLGDERRLEVIQKEIDQTLTPRSFALPATTIRLAVSFREDPVNAWNLIAVVPGSDPALKDEAVIVGAHYDHVGKDNRGEVHGGADDNASGTAAVLELARAFRRLDEKPKRTIYFVLFTAEEKGLLGSRAFVRRPPVPLDRTLAMINLDMIGRNAVDQISLLGRYQYPELYAIIDGANQASANLEINFSVEQFVRQSDHFPFMREKVPAVFFNSGSHEQLHRPEDAAGLIVKEKMERVTQLVFLSLWDLANQPAGTDLRTRRQS